jgi:hypothetical protein
MRLEAPDDATTAGRHARAKPFHVWPAVSHGLLHLVRLREHGRRYRQDHDRRRRRDGKFAKSHGSLLLEATTPWAKNRLVLASDAVNDDRFTRPQSATSMRGCDRSAVRVANAAVMTDSQEEQTRISVAHGPASEGANERQGQRDCDSSGLVSQQTEQ